MDDDKILIERALKAIINWNKGSVPFVPKYLEYQDCCDLIITQEDEETIVFSTKLKKGN